MRRRQYCGRPGGPRLGAGRKRSGRYDRRGNRYRHHQGTARRSAPPATSPPRAVRELDRKNWRGHLKGWGSRPILSKYQAVPVALRLEFFLCTSGHISLLCNIFENISPAAKISLAKISAVD